MNKKKAIKKIQDNLLKKYGITTVNYLEIQKQIKRLLTNIHKNIKW